MNLQPVDFKAVAAKGRFVYCYLRVKTSKNGKAGTPYYIGVASSAKRPIDSHICSVPPVGQRQRIRVLRSGLTWEEACDWEKFYIKHYGRIDLGTGILQNLTEGGDGVKGHGPAAIRKISQTHLGKARSRDAVEKQRMSHLALGRTCTDQHKKQVSEALFGHETPEETRKKISDTLKLRHIQKLKSLAEQQGISMEELMAKRAAEQAAKRKAKNAYFNAKYKALKLAKAA